MTYTEGACDDEPSDCEATVVTVGGGDWMEEVSWSISDCEGGVVAEGNAPFDGCLELPSDATISMFDSYGDGWNGNVLTIGEASFTLETGSEGSASLGAGCGDVTDIPGCMDESALNYNSDATVDDGSCEYESVDCDYELITVGMIDSYGDGWNELN